MTKFCKDCDYYPPEDYKELGDECISPKNYFRDLVNS